MCSAVPRVSDFSRTSSKRIRISRKKKRKKIDTNGDGDICQRENARGGRMLFEECGDDRD